MYVYVWLAVFVLSVLVEAATAGLASIWFAGGAFVAFLLALMGVAPVWQIVAFVVISLLLLVFTRPIALRYLNNRTAKTNVVDRIIGRNAIVTEEINNVRATGKVTVDGMPWTARTKTDEEIIPVGAEVVVDALQGVKCIVHEVKEG